jgi:DNA-binding NtrC family response regulator
VQIRKTILIVDDDPIVLAKLATRLQQTYEVLAAADGVRAAYVYERHQTKVAAIVTDLEMPRLDGQSLVDWVHHISPWLPVIIMSGAIRLDQTTDFSRRRISFLGKPFEPAQLEDLLQTALESGADGA